MIIGIFVLFMVILSITDMKRFIIPNIIVLPAIGVGLYMTQNYVPAILMFVIGSVYFKNERLCGGDVKLMAMIGAFIGWLAFPAFIIFNYSIKKYRRDMLMYKICLPCTPFFLVSSLITIGTNELIRWLIVSSPFIAGGV